MVILDSNPVQSDSQMWSPMDFPVLIALSIQLSLNGLLKYSSVRSELHKDWFSSSLPGLN